VISLVDWLREDCGHSVDPARWQEAFDALMGQIAGRFARLEPLRRVREVSPDTGNEIRKVGPDTAKIPADRTPTPLSRPTEVRGGAGS
jgi:hypothetical protein